MLRVEKYVHEEFTSNTFVLSHEDHKAEVWLIDSGSGDDVLKSLLPNVKIKGVFLTHGHYDHIYHLGKVLDQFPEAEIFCHPYAAEALSNPKLNLSFYHEDPVVINHDRVFLCEEGTSVQIFPNFMLNVYHTPGHNQGCICFGVDQYLFTGDSYIPGVDVVTKLKGGDKVQNTRSLARIKSDLMLEFPNVMPGHTLKESQTGLKILGA